MHRLMYTKFTTRRSSQDPLAQQPFTPPHDKWIWPKVESSIQASIFTCGKNGGGVVQWLMQCRLKRKSALEYEEDWWPVFMIVFSHVSE